MSNSIYSFLLFKALYAPKAAFAHLVAEDPAPFGCYSDIHFGYWCYRHCSRLLARRSLDGALAKQSHCLWQKRRSHL